MMKFVEMNRTISKIAEIRVISFRAGLFEKPPNIYPIMNTIQAIKRIRVMINNGNMAIGFYDE